jgi:hypothetical protein
MQSSGTKQVGKEVNRTEPSLLVSIPLSVIAIESY